MADGGVTSGPGEHEDDGGQQIGPLEGPHDLNATGLVTRTARLVTSASSSTLGGGSAEPATAIGDIAFPLARAASGTTGVVPLESGLLLGDGDQLRIDVGETPVAKEIMESPSNGHVLGQRDGATLGDDYTNVLAHLVQPLPEFLRVGHGRRESDDLDLRVQTEDDFLPDRATETISQVVHLVEHDPTQGVEGVGVAVDHIPQHLSRHDDNGSFRVDGDVTSQQTHLVLTVTSHQIMELLVGQRLDRGGVEALQT